MVTVGARTVTGAIEAGMAYAVLTQLCSYLPNRASPTAVVALAFALGTFRYATHPEGVFEGAQRSLVAWVDVQVTRVRHLRAEPLAEVA